MVLPFVHTPFDRPTRTLTMPQIAAQRRFCSSTHTLGSFLLPKFGAVSLLYAKVICVSFIAKLSQSVLPPMKEQVGAASYTLSQ